MVVSPAPEPPTPWRVRWTDEPNGDELMRSFADAWALAMPDPDDDENGNWHIPVARGAVLEAFNAGAVAIRVAWSADGHEVWIHFD